MSCVACVGECMMEFVERPDGTLTRGFGGDTLNTASISPGSECPRTT